MEQKPRPAASASSNVFARFGRPTIPHAVLPMPTPPTVQTVVETSPPLDLTGKRKVLFFIGRGRIGKTTLVRWMAEVMDERGGTALVAAADPTNRTLRIFRDNIAEPESEDADEVRDWLRDLLQHVMDNKLNAMIDLGGGNTSLSALLRHIPDLAGVLSRHGIEPVAVHVVGSDPQDLVPLAMMETAPFTPPATAIVCNEKDAPRRRFDQVLQHPTFLAAVDHGAVPLWMPRLNPDAVEQCDGYQWRYHDAETKAGPFVASSIKTWLRQMREQFAPIASWLPDA